MHLGTLQSAQIWAFTVRKRQILSKNITDADKVLFVAWRADNYFIKWAKETDDSSKILKYGILITPLENYTQNRNASSICMSILIVR